MESDINGVEVCLVDDHKIVREGLKSILLQGNISKNILEAENGLEFLKMLESYSFDLVLMDISMPVMNGIDAAKLALEKYPQLKILILSMFDDYHYYSRLIELGVKGFVLKTSGKRELEHAIRSVLENENYFSSNLLKNAIITQEKRSNKNTFDLSPRELETLKLLCLGYSTSEIAEKMFLSTRTIETHRSHLLNKTETKNTVSLVMYAIKNNIIDIDLD